MVRVFIGSSSESLDAARGLRANLEDAAEVRIWDEGLFKPGNYTLEDLVEFTSSFDYAIFICGADDAVASRGAQFVAPRDNVIFEAGLFYGRLGRERVFLCAEQNKDFKTPSDLIGLKILSFSKPSDGNYRAATGSAAVDIMARIKTLGALQRGSGQLVRVATIGRRDLFDAGIDLLRAASHSELLIYAPTGAWEPAEDKVRWFRTIATCLLNWQGYSPLNPEGGSPPTRLEEDIDCEARTTLESFKGVFGLPPIPRRPCPTDDDAALVRYESEKQEFARQLAAMEHALQPFNGIDSAQIRYLETDVRSIPGTGAIIFDTNAVTVGFATDGRYQVGYALTIQEAADIGAHVQQWFNGHLSDLVKDNFLQDMRQKINITRGFRQVRERYGIS